MRTFLATVAGAAATLLVSETVLAQAKSNVWIAEKIESTSTGNYILAMFVVIGAAVLIGLGMLRRSRR